MEGAKSLFDAEREIQPQISFLNGGRSAKATCPEDYALVKNESEDDAEAIWELGFKCSARSEWDFSEHSSAEYTCVAGMFNIF